MLREYAVEPEVFSDVDFRTFIQVLDGFSFSNGRLISTFPKKWAREVYSILNKLNIQDNKKKSIVNRLRKIAFAKRSCESWDSLKSWSENAQFFNQQDPFHAIISGSGPLQIDDLHDDTPQWKSERQVRVPRTIEGFEEVTKDALKFAEHVKFIDAHYSPSLVRFGVPLSRFVELGNSGRRVKKLEYHLGFDNSTAEHFRETLQSKQHFLKLESEQEFYFFRWKATGEENSENLHPRFILTESGGMHFDYGLDTGDGNNLVSLLENNIYNELWNQYSQNSEAFEPVDSWLLKDGLVKKL